MGSEILSATLPRDADIHVKESVSAGHRLYTVELQEIKMPPERGLKSINGEPRIEPHHTSDGKRKVAEEAAKVNRVLRLL